MSGTVIARLPYGPVINFGAAPPGILLVTKIPGLTPEEFPDERTAQKAIQRPTNAITARPLSFAEYKRCEHCWDEKVIQI